MRPIVAIGRLRGIADALERGAPVPLDDARWLAAVIRRYEAEASDGLSLDLAAGLVPGQGREAWWTCEARRRRDDAIRKIRACHFADLSIHQAARQIVTAARRYQNSAWRHDRESEPPADARKQLLAEALRTGLSFPGQRRVETILSQ